MGRTGTGQEPAVAADTSVMTLVRVWSRLLAAPSGAGARHDSEEEGLVEASRERLAIGLSPRDRLVSGALAAIFLAAAAPLALLPASDRMPPLSTAILLVAVYALATAHLPVDERPSYEEWCDTKIKRLAPLGRMVNPEEIGSLAVYVASEHARNITGQVLNVDGGWVMHW